MKNIIKKILRESELDWIKDVSDEAPSWHDRVKIPFTDLVFDYMLEDVDLLDHLITQQYKDLNYFLIYQYFKAKFEDCLSIKSLQ